MYSNETCKIQKFIVETQYYFTSILIILQIVAIGCKNAQLFVVKGQLTLTRQNYNSLYIKKKHLF